MAEIKAFESSTDHVESVLIKAVLDGDYPPGSFLPPERELASKLGVARPTLREALRRLERDGWFTVSKGLPTVVNDVWRQGNLNTLANIVQNTGHFTENFTIYLLEVRSALAPSFFREAVARNPAKVVAALADCDGLEDSPEAYSAFDWRLQKTLAHLSGNPIYLLILNSFDHVYIRLAEQYFSMEENRRKSRRFYEQLLSAAMALDPAAAGRVTREAMEESISLWKKSPLSRRPRL